MHITCIGMCVRIHQCINNDMAKFKLDGYKLPLHIAAIICSLPGPAFSSTEYSSWTLELTYRMPSDSTTDTHATTQLQYPEDQYLFEIDPNPEVESASPVNYTERAKRAQAAVRGLAWHFLVTRWLICICICICHRSGKGSTHCSTHDQ